MILNWYGSFSQGQGYSGSSEKICIALEKLGVDVRVVTFANDNPKNITKEGMDKRMIVLPKVMEQNIISRRLKCVEEKLLTEQSFLTKLQMLKSGLMGDLLSGRVRVEILNF